MIRDTKDRPISLRWLLLVLGLTGLTAVLVLVRVRVGNEPLPVLGTVGAFRLTNQLGQVFRESDLAGKVWVADIIFTRCPGPCIRMSRAFAALSAALPVSDRVVLVSLTADPAFDTPEVLRRYGEGYGATPGRWQFLTGGKAELYRLAIDDLLLSVGEIRPEERANINDLFIHSTRFVVVDEEGRLRGSYEGTEPETPRRIRRAVRSLLRGS